MVTGWIGSMVTDNGDRSGNGRKIIIRGSTDTKSMSLGHCGNTLQCKVQESINLSVGRQWAQVRSGQWAQVG